MSKLIAIQYGKRKYPDNIEPKICEIAAHFDVQSFEPKMPYSMHTEYCYGARMLNSKLVKHFPEICLSHRDQVPMLWRNNIWSLQFSQFIKAMVGDKQPPAIIEIHPPFTDYCSSISQFIEIYSVFEEAIHKQYPDTKIFIENRAGSIYRGGRFLISKNNEIISLVEAIKITGLKVRIVLDIPQLFTAHNVKFEAPRAIGKILELVKSFYSYRDYIAGIHLWGKKISGNRPIAHVGNLDTYFDNEDQKVNFLESMFELFNDNIARYFVPEVNSNDNDLEAIINDLIHSGFIFL